MIATALAVQEASNQALHEVNVINIARVLIDSRNEMTEMQFAKTLFAYSANLSAVTATLVTNVCLSKSQMAELISEIEEFENLEKEVVK